MQKKIKLSSAKFHCLLNWSNIQSNNINSGAMFVILSLARFLFRSWSCWWPSSFWLWLTVPSTWGRTSWGSSSSRSCWSSSSMSGSSSSCLMSQRGQLHLSLLSLSLSLWDPLWFLIPIYIILQLFYSFILNIYMNIASFNIYHFKKKWFAVLFWFFEM